MLLKHKLPNSPTYYDILDMSVVGVIQRDYKLDFIYNCADPKIAPLLFVTQIYNQQDKQFLTDGEYYIQIEFRRFGSNYHWGWINIQSPWAPPPNKKQLAKFMADKGIAI